MNLWTVALNRLLAALLIGGALQACQTTPPPSVVETVDSKAVALQTMGFVRSDDGWELSLGVKLLFETNKDVLSESGRESIDEMSRTLRQMGIDRIRVEGHTDNVGSAAYNKALSLRRAQSVANELIKGGWRPDSIERRGHGFDKPVADNATAEGRAQNRRVVITVPAD
jgi:outer membrane protein OmpA-like peptidoglycan-associated protein